MIVRELDMTKMLITVIITVLMMIESVGTVVVVVKVSMMIQW